MACPPVGADNPPALASDLSAVHVDKHGITIYTTFKSRPHEIVHAKVGKGGLIRNLCSSRYFV